MVNRSRAILALGGLTVISLGLWGAWSWFIAPGGFPLRSVSGTGTVASSGETASQNAVARRLSQSDADALSKLYQQLTSPETRPEPLTAQAGSETLELLSALRTGFAGFSPYARAAALETSVKLLERFTLDPAPAEWNPAFTKTHELLIGGLGDSSPGVRSGAISAIGRLWDWLPGRTLLNVEVDLLSDQKDSMLQQVTRCLSDSAPAVRATAVACIAALPRELDSKAEPAIAYLKDSEVVVRRQVLASFAQRPEVLSEELILPLLYDSSLEIKSLAYEILERRGLTRDQIGLGEMAYHPDPKVRSSTFAFLNNRTDIDAEIWLIHLSRDSAESIRLQAAQELTKRATEEGRARLEEMAAIDPSEQIRKEIRGNAPKATQTTAALPPLPGSATLNPRAN